MCEDESEQHTLCLCTLSDKDWRCCANRSTQNRNESLARSNLHPNTRGFTNSQSMQSQQSTDTVCVLVRQLVRENKIIIHDCGTFCNNSKALKKNMHYYPWPSWNMHDKDKMKKAASTRSDECTPFMLKARLCGLSFHWRASPSLISAGQHQSWSLSPGEWEQIRNRLKCSWVNVGNQVVTLICCSLSASRYPDQPAPEWWRITEGLFYRYYY